MLRKRRRTPFRHMLQRPPNDLQADGWRILSEVIGRLQAQQALDAAADCHFKTAELQLVALILDQAIELLSCNPGRRRRVSVGEVFMRPTRAGRPQERRAGHRISSRHFSLVRVSLGARHRLPYGRHVRHVTCDLKRLPTRDVVRGNLRSHREASTMDLASIGATIVFVTRPHKHWWAAR